MKSNSLRVLVVADIQAHKALDETNQKYLCELIQKTSPDLAVLLGDVLFGPFVLSKNQCHSIIRSVLEPFKSFDIPVAFVTGNHDLDTVISLEQQLEYYYEYSLFTTPKIYDRLCTGAYVTDVVDDERNTLFRLMFIDSGKTKISFNGIRYYPATNEQLDYTDHILCQKNTSPVIVFQHIPVPEIYQLLQTGRKQTKGTVPGKGPYKKQFLSLKKDVTGVLGEAPCPSWENNKQLSAWLNSKKVQAAVFGHDHKNAFSGKLQHMDIIQSPCAGLSCYGNDELRGCTLLTIHKDGKIENKLYSYAQNCYP